MGLNDPKWGNKNGGPPDLEELLRKLNDKLASIIGGSAQRAAKPGGGQPRKIGGGLGLLGAIAALIWVGSGF